MNLFKIVDGYFEIFNIAAGIIKTGIICKKKRFEDTD